MNIRCRFILLALAMALHACAAPVTEQERTGFISDYTKLEKAAENAYRYTSPAVENYSRFIIDGPYILFEQTVAEEERQFSEQEIEELKVYFREQLEKVLTEDDAYEVVESAGSGVANRYYGTGCYARRPERNYLYQSYRGWTGRCRDGGGAGGFRNWPATGCRGAVGERQPSSSWRLHEAGRC
jgi:hypothetical protein